MKRDDEEFKRNVVAVLSLRRIELGLVLKHRDSKALLDLAFKKIDFKFSFNQDAVKEIITKWIPTLKELHVNQWAEKTLDAYWAIIKSEDLHVFHNQILRDFFINDLSDDENLDILKAAEHVSSLAYASITVFPGIKFLNPQWHKVLLSDYLHEMRITPTEYVEMFKDLPKEYQPEDTDFNFFMTQMKIIHKNFRELQKSLGLHGALESVHLQLQRLHDDLRILSSLEFPTTKVQRFFESKGERLREFCEVLEKWHYLSADHSDGVIGRDYFGGIFPNLQHIEGDINYGAADRLHESDFSFFERFIKYISANQGFQLTKTDQAFLAQELLLAAVSQKDILQVFRIIFPDKSYVDITKNAAASSNTNFKRIVKSWLPKITDDDTENLFGAFKQELDHALKNLGKQPLNFRDVIVRILDPIPDDDQHVKRLKNRLISHLTKYFRLIVEKKIEDKVQQMRIDAVGAIFDDPEFSEWLLYELRPDMIHEILMLQLFSANRDRESLKKTLKEELMECLDDFELVDAPANFELVNVQADLVLTAFKGIEILKEAFDTLDNNPFDKPRALEEGPLPNLMEESRPMKRRKKDVR